MSSANRFGFMALTVIGFLGLFGNPVLIYAAPKMAVPQQIAIFQEVVEGKVLEHEFLIQNKGDQPLKIEKVEAG